MADVFVYAPNCTDFDNIGEAGSLTPTSCIHTEIKNGMSQLELVHPIDEMDKWTYLQNEYILVAEVPVRQTPEITDGGALVTTIEKWKVRASAPGPHRKVYSKKAEGKVLTTLKINQSVTVVKKDTERYKIKTKKYTGWIRADALEFEIVETIPNDPNAISDVEPAWTIRPQQFRIYKVEKTDKDVTVLAKHIFYDQDKNVTSFTGTAPTCVQAVQGLVSGCVVANPLTGMSNMLDTRAAVKWEREGFVNALLDPDTGLTTLWGAELVRDNDEFVVLREAGQNRGVRIEYGKNLNGVELTLDYSQIVTRYMPVGLTSKDKPLLLAAGTYITDHGTIVLPAGQTWVDAPNIGDYTKPYVEVLDLTSEVKAGTEGAASIRNAREKMIDLVLTKYEKEQVNYPKVTLNVTFEQLGDTEEYAQYRQLENIYLYDHVGVWHPWIHIDLLAEVTEYAWDVLREKAEKITLGNVNPATIGRRIPAWRLPSVIPGTKVGKWSVPPGALGPGAVGDPEQIQPGVIDPTHLTPDTSRWREEWFNDLAIPITEAIGNAEGRLANAEDRIEDTEGNVSALTVQAGTFASDIANAKGDISTIQQNADSLTLAVQGKLDADDPASGVQTSGIDIQAGRTAISTPVFAVNVEGTNGDMSLDANGLAVGVVDSPSVVSRYTGPSTIYVNKAASDAAVAAGTHFRSVKAAISSLKYKYIGYDVTISVANATYYETTIQLYGLIGGHTLTIEFNDSLLSGTVFHISHCTASIFISKMRIYQRGVNDPGLWVVASQYVRVESSRLRSLPSGSSAAIQADRGSNVFVTTTELYGSWRAIRGSGSHLFSVNNKGDCRLAVDASIMVAYGTQPCDQTTFAYAAANGGIIHQTSITVDVGTGTPPEPETATQTFAATVTRTAYGSAQWPGSWKSDTNQFWQGFTSGQGYQVGMMWFPGLSALNGKTILEAKLTLKRVSGTGPGGKIKVVGYYGDRASNAGSGSPTNRVSMGTLGTLSNGEQDSFSIPAAAVSYLAGGSSARCLALHPGDSSVGSGLAYSWNYGKFYGAGSGYVPELEVTYTP